MSRHRICFARTSYGSLGGGDRMLLRLLRGLDGDAFELRVLSSAWDECCRRASAIPGVSVDVVPYRGRLDRYGETLLHQSLPGHLRTAVRALQFDLEARKPVLWADAIWCDCLRTLLTVAPAARATRTPTIWNVGLGRTGDGTDRRLNAAGLLLADRVFIESREQARRTFTPAQLARHGDQFEIFHKGVDVERFRPRRVQAGDGRARGPAGDEPSIAGDGAGTGVDADPGVVAGANVPHVSSHGAGEEPTVESLEEADGFRVGTAARITPRKGLEDLIDAVAALDDIAALDDDRDLHLVVAGAPVDETDREYRRRLRARVAEHGIEDRVRFLGWVEEMPAFYAALDLFVLPSRDEGVPGAVREALACAVPVIATDVGGTRSVVRDGETGLLVEPGDPERLAAAIRYCVEHPGATKQLGVAGRRLVCEEFSEAAYVDRYEAFLQEVAADG